MAVTPAHDPSTSPPTSPTDGRRTEHHEAQAERPGGMMSSQGSRGWLTGLVVSTVSIALSAVLWSSPRL